MIEPDGPRKDDLELFISLGQFDGRMKYGDNQYEQYPFKNRLEAGQISIFELKDKTKKRLDTYDKSALLTATKINQTCDNSLRYNLKAGKSYIIVPAPKVACREK